MFNSSIHAYAANVPVPFALIRSTPSKHSNPIPNLVLGQLLVSLSLVVVGRLVELVANGVLGRAQAVKVC